MTRRHQWMLVGGIVLALAGGLYAAVLIAGDETSRINAGTRAPSFAARTLDVPPQTKTLADYGGHVVLFNIWRTDCLPCEKEMPSMQKLHTEFKDRGLRVVAVSVEPGGSEGRIRDFVRTYGITFDVLHDPTGAVTEAYQTLGVPETFVIGRDGIITRKVFSEQDWASTANRMLIAQLLGEPVNPAAVEQPQTIRGGEE